MQGLSHSKGSTAFTNTEKKKTHKCDTSLQLYLRMNCPIVLYEGLMLHCLLSLRWRSKYKKVHSSPLCLFPQQRSYFLYKRKSNAKKVVSQISVCHHLVQAERQDELNRKIWGSTLRTQLLSTSVTHVRLKRSSG